MPHFPPPENRSDNSPTGLSLRQAATNCRANLITTIGEAAYAKALLEFDTYVNQLAAQTNSPHDLAALTVAVRLRLSRHWGQADLLTLPLAVCWLEAKGYADSTDQQPALSFDDFLHRVYLPAS